MATPTLRLTSLSRTSAALSLMLLLAACQQPQIRPAEPDLIKNDPPAAGPVPSSTDACAPLPADWLEVMPGHQKRIAPADCSSHSSAPLFSWGEPRDRQSSYPWSFTIRTAGGGNAIFSRNDLPSARLQLDRALAPGYYEWSASHTNTSGSRIRTEWRRFTITAPVSALSKGLMSATTPVAAASIPDGQAITLAAMGKARPRVLAAGSNFSKIAAAAQTSAQLPILNALRASARFALTQPLPATPTALSNPTPLAVAQLERAVHQSTRAQRDYIEVLSVVGRIDGNAAMLSSARQRLLALASWSPDGVSGERTNDHANREIYLALTIGVDMLWDSLSASQRSLIGTSLRTRIMMASEALAYLEREPYESHRLSNVRGLNQALLLAVGLPNFPEAPALLTRLWDFSKFTLGAWGDKDGSFGNGIAYGWYAFVNTVPYVAAVRMIAGVDLYQLDYLRRAGEQLIAFTPPHLNQPSAFGDGAETADHYFNYASNYYRLHAQLTRDPVDTWYWQVNPNNLTRTNQPLIWQVLMLGVDSNPQASPQPPTRNDWFFPDAGMVAMHVNAAQSARTSVFFRSSRFGAFNHSHADQNSVAYTSKGQPLLIGSGYYPYYDSPHHKAVTRATRYKNALTFDGGFGQSERLLDSPKPTAPLHSMDASGTLIRTEAKGQLSAVTGDATLAYRAANPNTGKWSPLLNNAIRSVVMDRANGVTLIYDWATSTKARRWELNYHSPNAFAADASTVKAASGNASVCLDRYGPASSFSQTMAWDVAPEVTQPAQAHGRFTMLAPSTQLAHLTVLRDGCKILPVQVQQTGTRIQVTVGAQTITFDQRSLALP
jgi:hypothetical protein